MLLKVQRELQLSMNFIHHDSAGPSRPGFTSSDCVAISR